jgi:hypothetical protein
VRCVRFARSKAELSKGASGCRITGSAGQSRRLRFTCARIPGRFGKYPFNPKETLDDKLSILDIKARDQSGRQFNVEMQMLTYRYYEKRILYYGCKLHQQQLHEGDDYLKISAKTPILSQARQGEPSACGAPSRGGSAEHPEDICVPKASPPGPWPSSSA